MEQKQSGRWCGGWLLRRLVRTPGRTLLAMLVAAGLLVGTGYLGASITAGYARIDALYDTVEVTGKFVSRDYSYNMSGAFLPVDTMTPIEELGFFSETKSMIGGEASLVNEGIAAAGSAPKKQLGVPQQEQQEPVFSLGVYDAPMDEAQLAQLLGDGNEVTDWFSPYTQESLFQEGARRVLMEQTLLAELQLQVGNYVTLFWTEGAGTFQVIGSFQTAQAENCQLILSGQSLLELFDELRADAYYTEYSFTIDRAKNREIAAFRTEAEAQLEMAKGGAKVLLVMDDSELTQAVEPLERNISLLEILYPAMCALAIVIAAGLAALLLMQSAKEAAILRVLGVGKGLTAALLVAEQVIPALLGALLGALVLKLAPISGLVWREVWLCAAGYVLAAGVGAAIGALARVRKNPLELLQVKE